MMHWFLNFITRHIKMSLDAFNFKAQVTYIFNNKNTNYMFVKRFLCFSSFVRQKN